MTIDKIIESGFIQDLLKNPKPTFFSYLKKEGPIVTIDNKDQIVESLMVDYLFKKEQILQRISDYSPRKNDLETLIYFEEMISKSYGNRCEILHFVMYNPSEDIKEQLQKIMDDPDFVRWTFIE
jgi:hypothetical protein